MYARVTATQQLTPGLVRVVLGGGDLDRFAMPDATDAYVNVALPPPGAPYGPVFDPKDVRDQHPRPPGRRAVATRSGPGTLGAGADRRLRRPRRRGVAGPWAAAVRPGDVLVFEGPSGGYRPDPEADWHLMIGDESALPAIAASLEAVPAGSLAVVRIVCDGPDHELELTSPGPSTSSGCTAPALPRTATSCPLR